MVYIRHFFSFSPRKLGPTNRFSKISVSSFLRGPIGETFYSNQSSGLWSKTHCFNCCNCLPSTSIFTFFAQISESSFTLGVVFVGKTGIECLASTPTLFAFVFWDLVEWDQKLSCPLHFFCAKTRSGSGSAPCQNMFIFFMLCSPGVSNNLL